jgi:hypothetical protein
MFKRFINRDRRTMETRRSMSAIVENGSPVREAVSWRESTLRGSCQNSRSPRNSRWTARCWRSNDLQ